MGEVGDVGVRGGGSGPLVARRGGCGRGGGVARVRSMCEGTVKGGIRLRSGG